MRDKPCADHQRYIHKDHVIRTLTVRIRLSFVDFTDGLFHFAAIVTVGVVQGEHGVGEKPGTEDRQCRTQQKPISVPPAEPLCLAEQETDGEQAGARRPRDHSQNDHAALKNETGSRSSFRK
jgi:hypothetical protein